MTKPKCFGGCLGFPLATILIVDPVAHRPMDSFVYPLIALLLDNLVVRDSLTQLLDTVEQRRYLV